MLERKVELLTQKIKVLQDKLALVTEVNLQYEYQVRNGKMPPVEQYLKPEKVFEFSQMHSERERLIDLELENIELKEQLAARC